MWRSISLVLVAMASLMPTEAVALSCPTSNGEPVCPGPALTRIGEVLDGAVRVQWWDPRANDARAYAVDMRSGASGVWREVGVAGAAATEAVVRDLQPGVHQMRVRARYAIDGTSAEVWSAPSVPREIELRPPCAGAWQPSPGLPRVLANDRDGDGQMTGRDVARALRACAEAGGCVLQLLPAVYDDVAIVLAEGGAKACVAERSACLDLAFPAGLVIEGHGDASVLRSPLWQPPYRPVPVLEVRNRPDIRLALRNFAIDGRKQEQVAPRAGRNDSNRWWHHGLQVWNASAGHTRRIQDGCVHNLTVRNMLSRGISLIDVDGWVVEDSTVEDIGCLAGFTECPKLDLPDAFPARGYTAAGTGILAGWFVDDLVLRRNTVRRATKYAISLKHGQDGGETSIRRPLVEDNQLRDAGSVGIFVAGVENGRFARNVVSATQLHGRRPEHVAYYDTFALTCAGRLDQTLFVGNWLLGSAGIAVNWQCRGSGNVFAEGRIEGSCREKGPRSCAPSAPASCYTPADFNVAPRAAGELRLVDTRILDTGCSTPLASVSPVSLVVDGGVYAAGHGNSRPVSLRDTAVTLQGGARFEGVSVAFEGGTRAVVTEDVQAEGEGWLGDGFEARPGAAVLLCADEPQACAARCSVPKPPEWCGR